MKQTKSVLITACLFIAFSSFCFGGEKGKVNEWEIESTKTVNSIVNEEKGQLVSTDFFKFDLYHVHQDFIRSLSMRGSFYLVFGFNHEG